MAQTGGGNGGGRRRARRLAVLRSLFSRPSSAVGACVVAVFLLLLVFGPWIAPYSATQQILADARQGPTATHFFGTDHLGRDVFSRVILGTGSVVGLAGLGTVLAVVAGTLVGLVSGYRGGWLDEVLMRLFDSFLAIPALLLALLFLGALGPTRTGVALVILVVYMPIVARVVRSQVLATKSKAFVEMARLQGEPLGRILLREILPSALPALSVEAALRFSYAIFLVASLGFLGVGVGPPSPNWGLMVSEARNYATLTPWALFFPAGAIAVLVVAVNLTADGLKQSLLEPGRDRNRRGPATAVPLEPPADVEAAEALLSIRGLTVEYRQGDRWRGAVRDVSLDVEAGEVCAIVGESGSGKSTLALALLRHLSPSGRIRAGEAQLAGDDVLRLSPHALRNLRGRRVAFVPQDPQVSLNPSLRIGEQVAEQVRVHHGLGRRAAQQRVLRLLGDVDIADPPRVTASYPHQLSGGMQQRVMIAMALSGDPELLILDEPTTGLDVTTQAVVLDLLRSVIARRKAAALYVTHNLGVVAQIAQRVGVLYAGELVEEAPVENLFARPLHPYTYGLMASVPRLGELGREVVLAAMPGRIPALGEYAAECVFASRCPLAVDRCRAGRPALVRADENGRRVRCVRWEEIREQSAIPTWSVEEAAAEGAAAGGEVLVVQGLRKHFAGRRTLLSRGTPLRAVDGIDLRVEAGATLGLVGESGSGKSTLARAVAGLEFADAGELTLLGEPLSRALSERSRAQLRALQMVFQNPDEALNPYVAVGEALVRPLVRLRGTERNASRTECRRLLESVRLPGEYAQRRPEELSGGERQRVALARAFAAGPRLVILDEPTSSLDVSVQASLLNLLRALQRREGGAYLFISHDLAVVGHLADAVAVMYRGRLLEVGPTAGVFAPPYHPYTEALLASVPLADPRATQARVRLPELLGTEAGAVGCPFQARCPRKLGAVCEREDPPWRVTEGGGGLLCHIPLDELCTLQEPVFKFSGSRTCGGEG